MTTRRWLVVHDDKPIEDIEQIDVLPGEENEQGEVLYHGHVRGIGCDCSPTVLQRLSSVIVVHRNDI